MLNLNSIVAGPLGGTVHPQEPVFWFRCIGQKNERGVVTPEYAPPVRLLARVQSASDAALFYSGKAGENSKTRNFYISSTPEGSVQGLARDQGTGGDLLYYRGQWWLVVAVPEDFTVNGGAAMAAPSTGWTRARTPAPLRTRTGATSTPAKRQGNSGNGRWLPWACA